MFQVQEKNREMKQESRCQVKKKYGERKTKRRRREQLSDVGVEITRLIRVFVVVGGGDGGRIKSGDKEGY